MSLASIARWGAMLALALFVLDWLHITPASLWRSGVARLEAFKDDTRQVASGAAVDKFSQKLRAEMKEAQQTQTVADTDTEMSRELRAERARIMEAKLKALQEKQIVPVEQGQLARQVAENARRAGGDN